MGVTERAQIEWVPANMFKPKEDGSLRFLVVYRKLNTVTIHNLYPIPRMDECIKSLDDANGFQNCTWKADISK